MTQPFNFLDLVQSWQEQKIPIEKAPRSELEYLQELIPELKPVLAKYPIECLDSGQKNDNLWLKFHQWDDQTFGQRLQSEILQFHHFIRPTHKVLEKRKKVFTSYSKLIKKHTGRDVHLFGSTATNLFLRGGDMDMFIVEENPNKSKMIKVLKQVKNPIQKISANLWFFEHARIPILKFMDRDSHLDMDITCNSIDTLDAVNLTKQLLREHKALEPLVFLLKQFLGVRNLHSNSVGINGIGGYGMVLWVAAFLVIHDSLYPIDEISDSNYLGVYFINFLHFFGYCFDYQTVGLAPGGIAGDKQSVFFYRKMHSPMQSGKAPNLAIMDPLNKNNNVTSNSVRIHEIAHAFRSAYDILIETSDEDLWQDVVGKGVYRGYLTRVMRSKIKKPELVVKARKEVPSKRTRDGKEPANKQPRDKETSNKRSRDKETTRRQSPQKKQKINIENKNAEGDPKKQKEQRQQRNKERKRKQPN